MCSLDCPVTFACSILFSSSDIAKKKKRGGGRSGSSLQTHNESRSQTCLYSFLYTMKRLMKHNLVPSVAFDKSNNVPIITNHPLPSSVQDQRLGSLHFLKKKNPLWSLFFFNFVALQGLFLSKKSWFSLKKTWTDEKEKSRMIFTSQHPVPLELPYLEKKRASLARRGKLASFVLRCILFYYFSSRILNW